MKSLLTEADIKYLLEQQERLDADIRKRFAISELDWEYMDEQHMIALNVEIHEYINSIYKSWKYWKTKPMDRSAILDEAVDVIHFIMLMVNKKGTTGVFFNIYSETAEGRESLYMEYELGKRIFSMINYSQFHVLLVDLLQTLDFYDFDRKQIMQAYKDKNKVNFERLAGGY